VTDAIIQRDQDLCTGCQRCADNCPTGAIEGERGQPQAVREEKCVQCGQCVEICSAYDSVFDENLLPRSDRLKARHLPGSLTEPLFAVFDRNFLDEVRAALAEGSVFAVAQCDSTVAGSLAEDFGHAPGTLSLGHLAAALRKLGFRKVYNTNSLAALPVLEEAYELVDRLNCGRVLPVIDSSCPATVKFIEQAYPELLHYLSTCKSPHQVAGAICKSEGPELWGVDPSRIYSVSIGPCTSRKFEAGRAELKAEGRPERREVDAVLTTRELAYLLKGAGLDPFTLPEEEMDTDLAAISWLAHVYCTTGDVTQAVLRTCAEFAGEGAAGPAPRLSRDGQAEGARVASVTLAGHHVKGLAVSGLRNAIPFFDAIKAGRREFGFIEARACPLGCVSGGGQPKVLLPQDKPPVYAERASVTALEADDAPGRLSEHPAARQAYEYFGKACGDKSNRVLHTRYEDRSGEAAGPLSSGPCK
jgi:iron only hydrogenase large subunit-like protein